MKWKRTIRYLCIGLVLVAESFGTNWYGRHVSIRILQPHLFDLVELGDEEAVDLLIQADIPELADTGPCGETVLFHASSRKLVVLLLNHGLGIHARDEDGRTALHYAASEGHVAAIEALVERGSRVNEKDNSGNTPLHVAASAGQTAAVRALLELGANVNARNDSKRTPIHEAAESNQANVIDVLIAKGADVGQTDESGRTALHVAAFEGHVSVIAALAKHQSFEARDNNIPALYLATMADQPAAIKALIKYGADPNAKYQDMSVWDYASHLEAAKVLIESGAKFDANAFLHDAIDGANADQVRFAAKYGADVNGRKQGRSPLHIAVLLGDLSVVKALIESGANINARDTDGRTPLSRVSSEDIADLLIKHGARK